MGDSHDHIHGKRLLALALVGATPIQAGSKAQAFLHEGGIATETNPCSNMVGSSTLEFLNQH